MKQTINEIKSWKPQEAKNTSNKYIYIVLVAIALYFIITALAGLVGANTTYWKAEASELPQYEEIVAEVTAYSEIDSCHYEGCITASGVPAYIGGIACPRDMELGTQVKIKGVNYTCEDRTNKNLDGRFDIFYGYKEAAHKEALEFGVQVLTVKVIK